MNGQIDVIGGSGNVGSSIGQINVIGGSRHTGRSIINIIDEATPQELENLYYKYEHEHESVMWLRMYIINRVNCPITLLKNIMAKNKDDTYSRQASLQPQISDKERIQWMINSGQITQEDPQKHMIDKIPENKELTQLKNLIK